MKRVLVVGASCSGKTTMAKRISEAIAAPHVELDQIYWGPEWTPCPEERFRSMVRGVCSKESWVVDGNYGRTRDLVLQRATDVIWLNYPFAVVAGRALRRSMRRIARREVLFGGCRETFGTTFLSADSILLWVVRSYSRRRREFRRLFDSGAGDSRLIELRKPAEAERLLRLLEGQAPPLTSCPST